MASLAVKIGIDSDPALLGIVRSAVAKRSLEGGFTEDEAELLALAIQEAAANVICHTYSNRRDRRLQLEILMFPDRMEFILEDDGPTVNPAVIRARPLEEVRPGGLGVFIIESCMDTVEFDPKCVRGNRLRMVKFLPGKGSPNDEGRSSNRR